MAQPTPEQSATWRDLLARYAAATGKPMPWEGYPDFRKSGPVLLTLEAADLAALLDVAERRPEPRPGVPSLMDEADNVAARLRSGHAASDPADFAHQVDRLIEAAHAFRRGA